MSRRQPVRRIRYPPVYAVAVASSYVTSHPVRRFSPGFLVFVIA